MNFKELIETILKFKKESDSKSITLNSKIVKKNDIFLAISKDRDKNHQNILEATVSYTHLTLPTTLVV